MAPQNVLYFYLGVYIFINLLNMISVHTGRYSEQVWKYMLASIYMHILLIVYLTYCYYMFEYIEAYYYHEDEWLFMMYRIEYERIYKSIYFFIFVLISVNFYIYITNWYEIRDLTENPPKLDYLDTLFAEFDAERKKKEAERKKKEVDSKNKK